MLLFDCVNGQAKNVYNILCRLHAAYGMKIVVMLKYILAWPFRSFDRLSKNPSAAAAVP